MLFWLAAVVWFFVCCAQSLVSYRASQAVPGQVKADYAVQIWIVFGVASYIGFQASLVAVRMYDWWFPVLVQFAFIVVGVRRLVTIVTPLLSSGSVLGSGMALAPGRLVVLVVAVAIVASLVTLVVIGGVAAYVTSRPTPTVVRVYVPSGPGYSVPPLVAPVIPVVAFPTVAPFVFSPPPNPIVDQQQECVRLGYSFSNWPNAGCR